MKDVMTGSKERDSSIELLRIASMFSIMLCHLASHGGIAFDGNVISIPRLWYNFIAMGGNVGSAVFVLISGYYLVEDKCLSINFKRVLKLWGGGSVLFGIHFCSIVFF